MARMRAVALAFAAAISTGLAQPPTRGHSSWPIRRGCRQAGQGGDMKTVDGVDFWLDGSPPHRFQVLGVLEDERLKTGLIGLLRMSGLERDMARLAHQAGGDAIILTDARDDLKAVVGSSYGSSYGDVYGNQFNAWGSATSITSPIESRRSRYVVVKYLPDGSAPAWSAAPPQRQPDAPSSYRAGRF